MGSKQIVIKDEFGHKHTYGANDVVCSHCGDLLAKVGILAIQLLRIMLLSFGTTEWKLLEINLMTVSTNFQP